MTISRAVSREVRRRAAECCEYCRLSESRRSFRFQIDHITAVKHGGQGTLDNLCLACYECNAYKGSDIATFDPLTGDLTLFYNPREQAWDEHFEPNAEMTIVGLTPEGRATVAILRLNLPRRVIERYEAWILGEYPCALI